MAEAKATEQKSEVVALENLAPARKTFAQLKKQFVDEGKAFVPCRITAITRDMISDGDSIRPVAYVNLEPTTDELLVRDRNIMSVISLNMLAQGVPELGAVADYLNEHPEALCILLAGCTANAVQIPHKGGETTIDPLSGNEFTPKNDGVTLHLFDLKISEQAKARIDKLVDHILFG